MEKNIVLRSYYYMYLMRCLNCDPYLTASVFKGKTKILSMGKRLFEKTLSTVGFDVYDSK